MPRAHPLPGLLTTLILLGGCANPYTAPQPPSPEQIPELEAAAALRPGDADAATRLGAAYREAGRLDDALETLRATVEANPGHDPAVYFLGVTYEEAGADSAALALYQDYLERGTDPRLREALERRTELVRRRALRQSVRASIDREAELAATPPRPRTMAVFPFTYVGSAPDVRPLGRALSQMLVTDLSQTDRLTVLERVQVQYLAEELALAEAGRIDPATAVRGGRILGAERVVQGQLGGTGEELVLDAAVVASGEDPEAAEPLSARDALARFFDLEKQLALDLYEAAGVQLTPAERERVTQRRTENLEAVLAFGLGLEAQDAGRYSEAADHFERAVSLDPGFGPAEEARDASEGMAEAVDMGADELADLGWEAGGLPDEYAEWLRRQRDFFAIEGLLPGAGERDPVSELLRRERVSPSAAILEIVVPRPGGSP